jgi:CSLREA domain-containing protein
MSCSFVAGERGTGVMWTRVTCARECPVPGNRYKVGRMSRYCLGGRWRAWLPIILAGLVSSQHVVAAATFTVDSTADLPDATPGDGLCSSTGGGCTLRAAVEEANALSGADTVLLPAGHYPLPGGELTINDDLAISGAGSADTTINGNRKTRVMTISTAAAVTLVGMRIRHGAAEMGGGVFNDGTVFLTDVVLTANRATGVGGLGGALYNNNGLMRLNNVGLSRNRATGCGGGFFNNLGTVQLTDVTISGNRVGNAGGAFLSYGWVTMAGVTMNGNTAKRIGGAALNYGPLQLTNVTIAKNRASYCGGLTNQGGAVKLINVTVSGNHDLNLGGLYNDQPYGGTLQLTNTIIANNFPQNCGGTLSSLGHNIDSGTTCGLSAAGDLSNTDPLLGPLRDNGGLMKTCALTPGSPAIDAGTNTGCPATDAIGGTRPADGNGDGTAVCDVGAYEVQP